MLNDQGVLIDMKAHTKSYITVPCLITLKWVPLILKLYFIKSTFYMSQCLWQNMLKNLSYSNILCKFSWGVYPATNICTNM